MTAEQGFDLHPLAAQDITDIWEFIAERNPLAARRVREDILSAIRRPPLRALECGSDSSRLFVLNHSRR
jgi:plasmid stabilization system protein ParE